MHVEPATPLFGAFVTGVDLRTIDDRAAALLEEAWAEYAVLFLRDQPLTPDEHIAFAERFAPIDANKLFKPVDGHPRIAQVLEEADQTAKIGGGWHTDHSYDQIPARGSILLAGSIAMWDNRSTWHWALNDYDGHRRLMHRITVQGEPLHAAI